MSVRTNFRAGLWVGARVVFAFVYLLSIASLGALGYATPDPNGTVWLAMAAFLALAFVFPAALVLGGRP